MRVIRGVFVAACSTTFIVTTAFGTQPHKNTVGAWRIEKSVDPMTDAENIMLIDAADSGENLYGHPIFLIVRCKDKKLDIFIDWGQFIGDQNTKVTIRWGKTKPGVEVLPVSTDGTASFIYNAKDDFPVGNVKYSDGSVMVALLSNYSRKNSRAGTGLVAEVQPFESSPIEAVFDLSGFDAAYKTAIGNSCGIPDTDGT